MKVVNDDLMQIWDVMERNSRLNIGSVDFKWDMARNMKKVKDFVNFVRKWTDSHRDYVRYNDMRMDLCKKYAMKNPMGEPIVNQAERSFAMNMATIEEFNTKLAKLKEKNQKAIDIEADRPYELAKVLEREVDVTWVKIKASEIPDEMSALDRFIIMDMIAIEEKPSEEATDDVVDVIAEEKNAAEEVAVKEAEEEAKEKKPSPKAAKGNGKDVGATK